jgi:hypothetical protein
MGDDSDMDDDSENMEDSGKPIKKRRQRGQNSTDSRQRRLEKNRESARESRKRKKSYIDQLESKADILEKEVEDLKRAMQISKEKEKMAYLSHLDSVDQLLHGR